MEDRQLLDLSAKAANIQLAWSADPENWPIRKNGAPNKWCSWNPLEDDGDALRLAVALNILNKRACGYQWPDVGLFHEHSDDAYAATRRAIVLAAAEIGKGM